MSNVCPAHAWPIYDLGACPHCKDAEIERLWALLRDLTHPTSPTGKQFWIDRLKGQEVITDRVIRERDEARALLRDIEDIAIDFPNGIPISHVLNIRKWINAALAEEGER